VNHRRTQEAVRGLGASTTISGAKMPKQPRGNGAKVRHNPLEVDLTRNDVAEQASRKQAQRNHKNRGGRDQNDNGGGSEFLSAKMSQKVLQQARAQQADVAEESRSRNVVLDRMQNSLSATGRSGPLASLEQNDDEFSEADFDSEFGGNDQYAKREGGYVSVAGDEEMDEADRRALESFMSKDTAPRLTIAEVIYQKIQEKKAQMREQAVSGVIL